MNANDHTRENIADITEVRRMDLRVHKDLLEIITEEGDPEGDPSPERDPKFPLCH